MARNQRGAAEWAKRIDEWNRSGLSLQEFCRQQGINKATMSGWVYRKTHKQVLENERRGEGGRQERAAKSGKAKTVIPPHAFVPVRLRRIVNSQVIEPTDRSTIEVVVAGGRRVIVEKGFDADTLRRVVAALEAGSC